ncbi:MAG: CcmD family protein [Chitinophagia bacterium]|nr:CcmD family protein [Chitinophagia bacterium]
MKHIKHLLLLVLLALPCRVAAKVEMADAMRADGKIYVVVAVLATIFAGIFGYLIYIDRKLSKTEQHTK